MQSRRALFLVLVALLLGPVAPVACQSSPAPDVVDDDREEDDKDDGRGGGPGGAGGQSAGTGGASGGSAAGMGGGGTGGSAGMGGEPGGSGGVDSGGAGGIAGGTGGVAGGTGGVAGGTGGVAGGAGGNAEPPAGTFDRSRGLHTYLSWAEVDAIRAKVAAKAEPWASAAAQVIAAANAEAQSSAIYTVTANGGHNGDRNGFYSYRPGRGDRGDYSQAISFGRAVRTLGLAWILTGDAKYPRRAIRLLQAWMIDPATRMTPTSRNTPDDLFNSSIDITVTVPGAIYGLDLLLSYPGWNAADRTAVLDWTTKFAETWGNNTWTGQNYANWEVLTGMMAAAVVGRRDLIDKTVARWKADVASHMRADGFLLEEINRTTGLSYSLYAISAMIQAAEIARHHGVDLFAFRMGDGRGLELTLDKHAPYASGATKWPFQQTSPDIGNRELYELA